MISKALKTILLGDAYITSRIANRLFPISDYDKGLDSLYYIIKLIPGYVKNGPTMMSWRFTILTNCISYEKSWELALYVKQLFDKQNQKTISGITFKYIRCVLISDDYEFTVNNFGHTIEFELTTPNIAVEF